MIFNNFSFETCAIINVSWGKVNFVTQTKHLKRQVQKSDRINSDRQSGSDRLGSNKKNKNKIKLD